MKMTVHQRLSAQRRAEHSLAGWHSHRREVLRTVVDAVGVRCPSCWDIPITPYEAARMSERDWEEWLQDQAMYAHWEERDGKPEADDPKHWHIQWMLGYRG